MTGRIAFVSCMQCCVEDMKSGRIPDSITYEILTSDNGVICFKCKNDHENCLIIQEQPFEILLEMAIENLIDRYYREAIFNFASAQERCFEFCIELILFEKKFDCNVYENLWKKVYKTSSERQLGAFYSLYLMRFKKTFDYNNDKIKIRNSIVHKGKIATKQTAFEYGAYILNNIYTIVEAIVENISPKILNDFILKKLADKQSKANSKPNIRISTMSSSIVFGTCRTDEEIEQEQKLVQYNKLHPDEYVPKASEANGLENKKLYVNDADELILVDASDINVQKDNARYKGRRNLEELMKHVSDMREHYKYAKAGLVEKASVVSYLDE